jgi:NTE family protein
MAAKRVHLVLGAGGMRCISYVGALDALESAGIEVASISCASAGTLFGALYAGGLSPQRLETLTRQTDLSRHRGDRFLIPRIFRWPFSSYRSSGIPALLRKQLEGDLTFGQLRIPLATIAIDLTARRLLVYASETHPDMPVSEALEIATAAPGLYPPLRRGGRLLIDGAIASEAPVWLATRHAEQLPILVLTTGHIGHTARPDSLPEFLSRVISAGIAGRDDLLIDRTPRARRVEINCGDIGHNQFDLSLEQKVFLMEQGRLAVQHLLRDSHWLQPALGGAAPAIARDAGNDDKAAAYSDQIVYNFFAKEITMGHVIKSGDQSIINVESQLGDITQVIGDSNHLSSAEKAALGEPLDELKGLLEQQRQEHADEVALIEQRLVELLKQVDKPAEQRKKSLLEISASGLKEAASTLSEVVPSLLPVAAKIAAFAVGLVV